MKTIVKIFAALVMYIPSICGQTINKNLPKKITISGYIADSCIKKVKLNPDIFFHDNFDSERWPEGRIFPIKIINNRFSITIQPKDEISYFQFRSGDESNLILKSLEVDEFLVQAGDSIHIDLKSSGKFVFTGKGSEKLNYLHYAGVLACSGGNNRPNFQPNDTKQIAHWRNLAFEHLSFCLDSLEKIKGKITDDAYKILRLNTSAIINRQHISHVTSNMLIAQIYLNNIDTAYMAALKNELQLMDLCQREFACTDSLILDNAGPYITYLGTYQMVYNQIFSGNIIPPFENSFNKILQDYKGVLRDKVLAWSINRCFVTYNSSNFVRLAEDVVNDADSKALLNNVASKLPGEQAFDFSFEGMDGRQVKLTDFKGKVVVLEAWFNGCTGCVGLAKRMHPIMERYRKNKNIVFISLNVDRNKQRFLEGVASGKYGNTKSVFLYTNGKGWSHPMCLKYQWATYPQMLIIDKNGKLLSGRTIDPKNESKTKELTTLIDSHL